MLNYEYNKNGRCHITTTTAGSGGPPRVFLDGYATQMISFLE